MRNKIFSSQIFYSEQEMFAFINDSESKEPISVKYLDNNVYKLYYMW